MQTLLVQWMFAERGRGITKPGAEGIRRPSSREHPTKEGAGEWQSVVVKSMAGSKNVEAAGIKESSTRRKRSLRTYAAIARTLVFLRSSTTLPANRNHPFPVATLSQASIPRPGLSWLWRLHTPLDTGPQATRPYQTPLTILRGLQHNNCTKYLAVTQDWHRQAQTGSFWLERLKRRLDSAG